MDSLPDRTTAPKSLSLRYGLLLVAFALLMAFVILQVDHSSHSSDGNTGAKASPPPATITQASVTTTVVETPKPLPDIEDRGNGKYYFRGDSTVFHSRLTAFRAEHPELELMDVSGETIPDPTGPRFITIGHRVEFRKKVKTSPAPAVIVMDPVRVITGKVIAVVEVEDRGNGRYFFHGDSAVFRNRLLPEFLAQHPELEPVEELGETIRDPMSQVLITIGHTVYFRKKKVK